MNWKARSLELAKLRAKHLAQAYQNEFPDLTTPPSPCTNGFGPTPARAKLAATGFIVSHLHKSSYQVLGRNEVQYAGRKV